jgi:hypothetical protein
MPGFLAVDGSNVPEGSDGWWRREPPETPGGFSIGSDAGPLPPGLQAFLVVVGVGVVVTPLVALAAGTMALAITNERTAGTV